MNYFQLLPYHLLYSQLLLITFNSFKETYVLSRDKNMSPKVCLHQNSKETYMATKFGKRDITCLPRTQKRHITGHI